MGPTRSLTFSPGDLRVAVFISEYYIFTINYICDIVLSHLISLSDIKKICVYLGEREREMHPF